MKTGPATRKEEGKMKAERQEIQTFKERDRSEVQQQVELSTPVMIALVEDLRKIVSNMLSAKT
eukprot:1160732-Pelagomonas_calceolata.AAC.5